MLASQLLDEHNRISALNLVAPSSDFHVPLLVASSNSATSTAAPGKCTYRTTLPRIKTFLTED